MSAADIQAFLVVQTGTLDVLVRPDVNGVAKPASSIIYEASQTYSVNPKVILSTLQKEQSLLTQPPKLGEATLNKAMGAGVYDRNGDGVVENVYPGFGKQISNGARLLSEYGEPAGSVPLWPSAGADKWMPAGAKPVNLATYKQYVYTPSLTGPASFYNIYNARWGDPAAPAIAGPAGAVFRFFNVKTGSHFYSASLTEANRVAALYYSIYRYEGMAYVADPPKNATPLYRFFNKTKGSHFYTATVAERDSVIKRLSKTYTYEGVAYNVSAAPATGAVTVYRFLNRKNGTHFYTATEAERDGVRARLSSIYTYEGIAFYAMP
jgi:hypothetical protein